MHSTVSKQCIFHFCDNWSKKCNLACKVHHVSALLSGWMILMEVALLLTGFSVLNAWCLSGINVFLWVCLLFWFGSFLINTFFLWLSFLLGCLRISGFLLRFCFLLRFSFLFGISLLLWNRFFISFLLWICFCLWLRFCFGSLFPGLSFCFFFSEKKKE